MIPLIFIISLLILSFVVIYRNADGGNVYEYVTDKTSFIYEKVAPYSYKTIRDKVKDLGQDYSAHQYMVQIIVFAVSAGVIS